MKRRVICIDCGTICTTTEYCVLCGEQPEPIDYDYCMCRSCKEFLETESLSDCCGSEVVKEIIKPEVE